MPELEPITREEKLLDGQDLEPITRREMFIKRIYDKTQTIPEPITREEYFLKKAGEGSGGDITIEQLTVTANGTYQEEGKAYSPVVVNVPTPENSYQLKSIENTPTPIATFNASALPMPSLKIGIEPVQEGSGDPSPTNKRPISGHTEANVVVSPTTDAEDGNTYTIDLGGTRYGCTLDVVSGELVVDRVEVDLGSMYWNYSASDLRFYNTALANVKAVPNVSDVMNGLCSHYKTVAYRYINATSEEDGIIGMFTSGTTNYLAVKDTRYTSSSDFTNAVSGTKLVYELATPQTYQLTPTAVKSLLGTNNIWADTGDVIEGSYFKSLN